MSRPIIGNNIPIIPAPMEININFQKIILSFSSIIVGGCVNNKTKKITHAIHTRIAKSRVTACRPFIFFYNVQHLFFLKCIGVQDLNYVLFNHLKTIISAIFS